MRKGFKFFLAVFVTMAVLCLVAAILTVFYSPYRFAAWVYAVCSIVNAGGAVHVIYTSRQFPKEK